MNTDRVEQQAILLPDGKVLVAGGENSSSILASCEIYDPTNGKWTYTGSMNYPRHAFIADLLKDGKVLVAGGVGEGGFLSSSELYDPSSGRWTITGNLNSPRSSSSILLPNDKVLIAGGENGNGWLTSAELFDPTTGKWTYTGSMHENHTYQPLIPLANHLILFAGAPDDSSCELYNLDTGTWTYTGSMNEIRRGAAVALLPNGTYWLPAEASGEVLGLLQALKNMIQPQAPGR